MCNKKKVLIYKGLIALFSVLFLAVSVIAIVSAVTSNTFLFRMSLFSIASDGFFCCYCVDRLLDLKAEKEDISFGLDQKRN